MCGYPTLAETIRPESGTIKESIGNYTSKSRIYKFEIGKYFCNFS